MFLFLPTGGILLNIWGWGFLKCLLDTERKSFDYILKYGVLFGGMSILFTKCQLYALRIVSVWSKGKEWFHVSIL